MLARQSDRAGKDDAAEAEYETVFGLAPGFKEGAVDYANFLVKVKKFDQALLILERLRDEDKFQFEYFLIRGRALMGLGNYGDAIASFLEGNKIYNSDVRLLNALGYCYSRAGDRLRALETLRASLRLNPNQDEVKKLIAEIEQR
ncbi:MAG: tetratricopeptide repeat protein, partial [Acidobacteriota bacterium]